MNPVSEGLAAENPIVGVVSLHLDTHSSSNSFKIEFCIDGVRGIESDLVFNMDVSRGSITENGGATKLRGRGFLSGCVQQSTPHS
jgi:hypothetical protein